ncbi:MAG: hypothetical protein V4439_02320 [Patescibacteria group bacterium]
MEKTVIVMEHLKFIGKFNLSAVNQQNLRITDFNPKVVSFDDHLKSELKDINNLSLPFHCLEICKSKIVKPASIYEIKNNFSKLPIIPFSQFLSQTFLMINKEGFLETRKNNLFFVEMREGSNIPIIVGKNTSSSKSIWRIRRLAVDSSPLSVGMGVFH